MQSSSVLTLFITGKIQAKTAVIGIKINQKKRLKVLIKPFNNIPKLIKQTLKPKPYIQIITF
ncbi:hypothetical protein N478_07500 [Pseudoalteromonas luteoviolacea S4060-1]|uniref:Uncharacterized protein n=1 Tax=Pseudoalteromonas luteoviolacea S4060-1 TaxID=1365257 RepID=A0A167J1S3_9GAMM|nr:hypothetical protein N478_07500 [Pseudoalteromonas luteoviolacea S4060-1]